MQSFHSILLFLLPVVCLGQTSVPLYESIYTYEWSPNNYQWSSLWKERTIDFIYDWNNVLSKTHQKIEDIPFDYDQLENFNYDSNGRLSEHEINEWNNGIWEPTQKFNYFYNADGQQTQKLKQTWNGNAWVNYNRWIHTYSSEGLRISYLKQLWSSGQWKNDDLDSSFYNNLDQLVELRSYNWWDDSTMWTLSGHELFEYDSLGLLVEALRQSYHNSTFWLNTGQSLYFYNSEQNLTNERNFTWEGTWSMYRNISWTYDTEGRRIEETDIMGEGQNEKVIRKFRYHESGIMQYETRQTVFGDYVDSGDSTWYNFSVSNEIGEESVQSVIYPNPATDNLRILCKTPLAQVILTDLAGRIAIQKTLKQVQSDVSVDVSTLPTGIYLLEAITEDGKRSAQKVVVQ